MIWLALFFLIGCRPNANPTNAANSSSDFTGTIQEQSDYTIHQHFTLVNNGPGKPEKQNLWVALIRDFPPYQQVKSMDITPINYKLIVDELGNQYAEFDFSDQGINTTQTVEIEYQVTVNELAYDLSNCVGETPGIFTQPELHIESANPQITALAKDLSKREDTACAQVRAFYDYIGDHLVYTYNGANWGAQAALGSMGADCTEYADLLVALSRAKGIPARYFEGLLYLKNAAESSIKTEHAWADTYLPSIGWVASDPTLGRLPADRDTYFAHYTPDHIIVTLGASPSVLRGSSYWTHLYWPGNSTSIQVTGTWQIEFVEKPTQ